MPEVVPVQDALPNKTEENTKIRALVDAPSLDWQRWDVIIFFLWVEPSKMWFLIVHDMDLLSPVYFLELQLQWWFWRW